MFIRKIGSQLCCSQPLRRLPVLCNSEWLIDAGGQSTWSGGPMVTTDFDLNYCCFVPIQSVLTMHRDGFGNHILRLYRAFDLERATYSRTAFPLLNFYNVVHVLLLSDCKTKF